jgi:hypothetical protein
MWTLSSSVVASFTECGWPDMADYLVTWAIDIEADDPIEAAAMALAVHRDPESTATHFVVLDKAAGEEHRINGLDD